MLFNSIHHFFIISNRYGCWPCIIINAMTIFCCYYRGIPDDGRVGIIIMCVFVQWIAMIWYTISFIPFARDYVCMVCGQGSKDCCKKAGGK